MRPWGPPRLPWGKFWRLLDQLTRSNETYYYRAQQEDPELSAEIAGELLSEEDGVDTWTPPAADWSMLHELMAQNRDRLGQIAALLADLPTAVKVRHDPPPPYPRPETALTKAMARVKAQREQAYDDRILDFAEKAKQRYREIVAKGGPEAHALGY